ncbi:hypothetical protein H0H92_012150, partial [Tricholoma furcatifolium]
MVEKSEHISIRGLGLFGDLTTTNTRHISPDDRIPTLTFPTTHSLRFVKLDAPTLTLQLVQDWIKLVLPGCSTIKHLALPSLSPLETWVLPVVADAFAQITWLTVRNLQATVMPNDILKLLYQLPLLTTLELDGFEMFYDWSMFHYPPIVNPLSAPLLPILRNLTCAPTFLEFVVSTNTGPQLERVNILLLDVDHNRANIGHPLGSARISSKALDGLRTRATYPRLCVQLSIGYSTLGSTLQPEDLSDPAWVTVMEATAELYLCQGFNGAFDLYDASYTRLALLRLTGWLKTFSKLRKLVLWDVGDLKDEINTTIGKWDLSSICPTLKEIH